MKVLLDEGVPRQVGHNLGAHDVIIVPDAGWASAKNGVLLELIERSGFRVFVTCDKNIEYQQHELDRSHSGFWSSARTLALDAALYRESCRGSQAV